MEIHDLDSAYSGSERARANFRLAVALSFAFVGILWLIQLSNWLLDLGPGNLGVRPREWSGLLGVLVAPLMHGGFEHLLAPTRRR